MKLSNPAVRRALIAALVIGAVAIIVVALMPPQVIRSPLEGAQLAGTRGIRLEGEQPVPRFDDQRAPIVVAPPAQGQWSAFAVGMDQRVRLTTVVEPIDDVQRIRVQPPLPIGRWDLVLEDDARQTRWPVRFAAVPEPSAVIARLTVEAEALDVADRPAFWATAAQAEAVADQQVAAVELGRAHIAAGDMAQATVAYRLAARLAGEIGEIGEQAGRLRAAAWAQLRSRRFEQAQQLLDEAEAALSAFQEPWALARVDYLRGSTLRKTAMFRASAASLKRSLRAARWFDDQRLSTIIVEELASLLSELGRHAEALALLTDSDVPQRERGRRLVIQGWIATRASTRQPKRWPAIRETLNRALALDLAPDLRLIALTNLIELDLQSGRIDDARDHLGAATDVRGEYARLHLDFFRGQLARRRGDFDRARAELRTLYAATSASLDTELCWQAAFELFLVAQALDDPETADRWLQLSLEAVEVRLRHSAIHEGRATTLADYLALTEALVAWNIDRRHAHRALALLDATRAWVLRDLDSRLRVERLPQAERTAWLTAQTRYRQVRSQFDAQIETCRRSPLDEQKVCEARLELQRAAVEAAFDELYAVLDRAAPSALADAVLPTLPAGKALFTTIALKDRTLAFWLQGTEVVAVQTTVDDPLAPFAQKLAGLGHLYVVSATGMDLRKAVRDALAESDTTWSELPFAGLLAQPQIEARGAPVVIADPGADLQHARAEGRAVHGALGGEMLLGEQATRSATLEALSSGARLLHFAGHGALDADSPWQAHLVLANDERLTLADLLVARPILGIVVLSGCETGVRGALSSQHAVGLPDAFLLSGARAVIATDRVVPDADARAFVDHFYKHPDWETRPAAAFHSAVRALRAAGNPIWTAFRLMGRA